MIVQAKWYIDPLTGNDQADGETAATAIKTDGEFLRRWGTAGGEVPYLDIRVDVWLLNSIDEFVVPPFNQGPNAEFHVHGVPALLHGGTLSAVTPRSPTSKQADEFADGTMDWTPYVGKIIYVDVGDPVNGPARGIIAEALSSPNRARLAIVNQFQAADPINPVPYVCSAGQTYQIVSLPQIGEAVVPDVQGIQPFFFQYSMDNLDFSLMPTFLSQNFLYENCNLGVCVMGPGGWQHNCVQSFLAGLEGAPSTYFGLVLNGLVYPFSCVFTSYGLFLQGSQIVFSQTAGALMGVVENHHASYGLGIFDVDTPLMLGPSGTLANESTVYGTGIGPTACLHAFNGGRCVTYNPYYVQVFYIDGSGATYSDILLNGQSAVSVLDPSLFGVAGANPYTAPRACSFANLLLSKAAGGFGGYCNDPQDHTTCITSGQGI